jgi:hypothetical protein
MPRHQARARRMQARHGRAALLWGVVLFVAMQAAFLLAKERPCPDLRDPEYGRKLACLRQRLAERPQAKPVVLLMGSSRVAMGFRAEDLAVNQPGAADAPLVFNFGMTQCTAVGNLLVLRRLLEDGIRPDMVVVEFLPHALPSGSEQADLFFDCRRLSCRDLARLHDFTDTPDVLTRKWLQAQLVPANSYRHILLNRFAPCLVPPAERYDQQWRVMGPCGWVAESLLRSALPSLEAQREKELRQFEYRIALANLRVHPYTDRAVHQFLQLCRDEGITAAFLITPEPSYIRELYSPGSRRVVVDYLQALNQEFGTPVIDAQDWVADEEFFEGVHLIHAGAGTFAKRFECDALPALLNRSLWQTAKQDPQAPW